MSSNFPPSDTSSGNSNANGSARDIDSTTSTVPSSSGDASYLTSSIARETAAAKVSTLADKFKDEDGKIQASKIKEFVPSPSFRSSKPPVELRDDSASIHKFIRAEDPITLDLLLRERKITNIDVVSVSGGFTSLLWAALNSMIDNVLYLLTYFSPANINYQGGGGYQGDSALMLVAKQGNHALLKALIDFGADRSLSTISRHSYMPLQTRYGGRTALDFAREIVGGNNFHGKSTCVKLLEEYFPSEGEKLESQLKYKMQIDELFKSKGYTSRYNQDAIDLKYQSISAFKSGDTSLLKHSLAVNVDKSIAITLTIIAIENDQLHLVDCLCESLLSNESYNSSCLPLRSVEQVDPSVFRRQYQAQAYYPQQLQVYPLQQAYYPPQQQVYPPQRQQQQQQVYPPPQQQHHHHQQHQYQQHQQAFLPQQIPLVNYQRFQYQNPRLQNFPPLAKYPQFMPYKNRLPHEQIQVNKSLLYYLVNLLHHKFIYMDMEYSIELLEALELEGLYF